MICDITYLKYFILYPVLSVEHSCFSLNEIVTFSTYPKCGVWRFDFLIERIPFSSIINCLDMNDRNLLLKVSSVRPTPRENG